MLRRRPFRAALVAVAVPAVLAGLPTGLGAGLGAAAAADPGIVGGEDATVHTQPPKATTTGRREDVSRKAKRALRAKAEDDSPLQVSIDSLSPAVVPAQGDVTISGTVTNTDSVTRSTINVYAFISPTPMTTATELELGSQTDPNEYVGDRIADEEHKATIPELAPGDTAPFTVSVPRKLLGVSDPGVYWFGVHALSDNPEGGRDTLTDGRARTFLPLVSQRLEGQEQAAVVLPLRHQLDYTEDGRLEDLAGWIRTLSDGGRLSSLVDLGAASGDTPVTWVVDPALVDAMRRLAAGNPPRSLAANLTQGQEDGEPAGTESADPESTASPPTASPTAEEAPTEEDQKPLDLAELDPLEQAASTAAQSWLDRLGAAMGADDQVLVLPYGDVDVAGAAAHDPALLARAVERSSTGLAGFDVDTAPVVSSPSGYLSGTGLGALDPAETVLMSDAMFDADDQLDPAPPAALVDGHRVVVTSTGASDGGPGPDARDAVAAMRQRLLSEAAIRFLDAQRPPVTMVVPHDWNPQDPQSFFDELDVDWLDLTTVAQVSASSGAQPVDSASLRYPDWQAESELDQASFDAADGLIRSGAALQSMLTLNNVVGQTVADQALGTASYAARTRPIANRASADRSRQWILGRLAQVTVTAPPAVTLSSSSGRLGQVTVSNGLDQPVTVSLDARTDDQLTISGPRRFDVPAHGRYSVPLTARTDENGIHDVRLMVTDKRGVPLGGVASLSVRSAQISDVIWLFIGVGAALLFGAIGLRLFRRIRDARRTPAPATPPLLDDAAPDQVEEPAGAGTR